MDEEIMTLKDLLSSKKSEQDRELRAREKVEATLRQTTDTVTKKDSELTSKISEAKQLREQMVRVEVSLREERQKVEKTDKEMEHLNSKLTRIQQESDDQAQAVMKLMNENQQHLRARKEWEDELAKQRDDCKLVSRARDALLKRIKSLEDAKITAEVERDDLKV